MAEGEAAGRIASGRLAQVEALFHRAMELPAAERADRVAAWSGGDDTLRQEVLELLAAELAVEEALAAQAIAAQAIAAASPMAAGSGGGPGAGPDAGPDSEPEAGEDAWEGRVVGEYRLLRLLGRGGMGVVYLAERSGTKEQRAESREQEGRNSEEPAAASEAAVGPGTRVAIKFVRRSLRGTGATYGWKGVEASSESPAVRHFLLERDALATLQHPNIARLLDAGLASEPASGSGDGEAVPYVVMEFVEGRRLDAVCDDAATTARGVAGLMLQLCDAVGFAHRNLVLHRDLKPGNVMVSGEGAVKLLDFGTLKMLGVDAGQSAMTQAGMRPVTLRYAAPEHVLGDAAAAPVTTAADVYSLGMVLYRGLAGRLPPELDEPGASAAGTGVLRWFEHLRTGAVTPPSRVARKTAPRELAGDLDAIALKALRYEPEARYASAEALGEDLRKALAGEPVGARGDSRQYRLRRLYGRNRGVFWAGAAAAGVLAAGLLAMRHETRVARTQERTASAGVEGERLLAHTLLFDYFDQLRALPGSTDAQKRAVTEALAYLNGLSAAQTTVGGSAGRTESTRELQMDQVQGYTSMGSVLGSPYEDNLGQPDAAAAVLGKGVALAGQLVARYPDDTDVLKAQAGVSQALANVYVGQIRMKDALAANNEATAASERLAAQATATVADLAVAASSHDAMGDLLSGRDGSDSFDPVRAEQFYQQALGYDRRELSMDPGFFRARRGVAVEFHKLGVLLETTDPVASAAFQQKALDWLDAFSAADRAKPAVSRLYYAIEQHIGYLEVGLGRTREGLARIEDVLARYKAVYAADPINNQAVFDLADVEANLAESYERAGSRKEAAQHFRASVDDMRVLLKHDPKSVNWGYREAYLRFELARVTVGLKSREAHDAVAGMLTFARQTDFNAPDLPEVLDAMHDTGMEPALALAFSRKLLASAPGLDSYGLTLCAQAAEAAGEHAEARQLAARALEKLSREKVAISRQREDLAVATALAHGAPAPR